MKWWERILDIAGGVATGIFSRPNAPAVQAEYLAQAQQQNTSFNRIFIALFALIGLAVVVNLVKK